MTVFAPMLRALHQPIYAARLRELVRVVVGHLEPGDTVLDVGCGFGGLGRAIMDAPSCPEGVTVRGLERFARDEQLIPIDAYDGVTFPYGDDTFDVVILADVLHHEQQPDRLIEQCLAVARRRLIIKDHKIDGPLARPRICLIDWAANHPYGVECLYRYNTLLEWRRSHHEHGAAVVEEMPSMKLYPPLVNLLFGKRLQYLVVLDAGCSTADPVLDP